MRARKALEADVCIVGAGFAGLTAALRVAQAGRSVVVLAYKIGLVYDEPFWRSDRLSGESLAIGSPLAITIDACGAATPPGILNTFACGPEARALGRLAPAERRRFVIDQPCASARRRRACRTTSSRTGQRRSGRGAASWRTTPPVS